MSHPYNSFRQHDVERSRVGKITKGYASGGAVKNDDRAITKKAYGERDSQAVEGGSAKERMDRPGRSNRARGGRTKHKSGGNKVNVIVAPQGGQHPPMMPPGAPPPGVAAGPPPMPPRPMMPPPGAGGPPPGAMPPPGMAPPGMPPRNTGGRTYAKGGAVPGPGWKESLKAGTQVQNNPSGKNDQRDVNRGKPITYKTGGRITSENGPMGPKFDGGAGGGRARIEKEDRAEKKYAKAK